MYFIIILILIVFILEFRRTEGFDWFPWLIQELPSSILTNQATLHTVHVRLMNLVLALAYSRFFVKSNFHLLVEHTTCDFCVLWKNHTLYFVFLICVSIFVFGASKRTKVWFNERNLLPTIIYSAVSVHYFFVVVYTCKIWHSLRSSPVNLKMEWVSTSARDGSSSDQLITSDSHRQSKNEHVHVHLLNWCTCTYITCLSSFSPSLCLSLSLRQYGHDFHPDPNIMGVFNNFADVETDEVSYLFFPS